MRRALKRKFIKYYPSKRYKYKFFANILDLIYMKLSPEKEFAQNHFKSIFGYDLDLENPKTFNEKLNWLKINDKSPLQTICADKFLVRKYIADTIGESYLIPLISSTKNIEDINSNSLPNFPVILKTNHDSGSFHIIKDKNKVDWENIKTDLKRSLNSNYYFSQREWQYLNITPLIIVEKLLTQENGNIPYDYKLFCFNGVVHYISVDIDKETDRVLNFYNKDWELQEFDYCYKRGEITKKPALLDEMIELAEQLAKPFPFVRIDFYEVEHQIYFGEITFHPTAGFGIFNPNEWDYKFGEKINLPINS